MTTETSARASRGDQNREKPLMGASAFVRDLRTLPNLVSLARIVFIYVALGLFFAGHPVIGLAIGVAAGLSDYLDGYLARKLNQSTRIGGLLDQAADILFITGVIFMFVDDGTWPPVLLLIVLLRETVVMNLRTSAAQMGFSIPSIFLGKWASNWMFYALAVMGLYKAQVFGEPWHTYVLYTSHFAMVVGLGSSLITAWIYLLTYVRRYRSEDEPSDAEPDAVQRAPAEK